MIFGAQINRFECADFPGRACDLTFESFDGLRFHRHTADIVRHSTMMIDLLILKLIQRLKYSTMMIDFLILKLIQTLKRLLTQILIYLLIQLLIDSMIQKLIGFLI